MNLSRSATKLFLAEAAGSLIAFLGIVAFSRELSLTQLGTFFLFQAILTFSSIPADLGIRGAVEKRISEGTSEPNYFASAIVLKLAVALIVVFLILSLSPFINGYVGNDIAFLLVGAILAKEAGLLMVVVLRGELRVAETATIVLLRRTVWVVLGVLLVQLGFGVRGPIYSLIVSFLVITVVGWYKISIPIGAPTPEHGKSLFNYSRYDFISSLGGYSYGWIDILIIGFFLSQSLVAAYEVAWRVTTLFMILTRSISSTIFPQLSRWSSNDQTSKVESIIPKALIASLLFSIPALFGIVVISTEILRLIFSPKYVVASMVLVILMAEQALQAFHVIFGRTLQAINRPEIAAKTAAVAVVLNLFLNVVLVNQFGIEGAAIATATAFGINSILQGYYLKAIVDVNIPWIEISSILLASSIMAGVVWLVRMSITIDSLPLLGITIVSGVLTYGVVVLLFAPLRNRILEELRCLEFF